MRIKTNGESLASSAVFASLVPAKAGDMEIKSFKDDSGKVETKVAPDGSGRAQYRTNLQAMALDDDGNPYRQERDVTVSILEPADVQFGQVYNLKGQVWVTHYVTNGGRMGVSIVAESVTPANAGSPAPRKEQA